METLIEDTFEGEGTLLSHVSDSGDSWVNIFEGGTLDIGGGFVFQRPGFSTSISQAGVDKTLFVAGDVEFLVELDVIPGNVTGTVSAGATLGNDDSGIGFTVNVGNYGYCTVSSDGAGTPASTVLSSGGEEDIRTHTIRVVATVGSTSASLYANGILVGPFSLSAPLAEEVRFKILLSPNRTIGNTPLVGIGRIVVLGEGAIVGEFWTNIIRAAETP